MRNTNEYEAVDKAALYDALLQLHQCPNRHCRRTDLKLVAYTKDVYGCPDCKETWHIISAQEAQR